MKTHIRKLLFAIPVAALLVACETEKATLYDTAQDGMYFSKKTVSYELVDDTVRMAFGSLPDPYVESAVFPVPVILMGSVADVDREFDVEVLKDKTNPGTRYEIVRPLVLKAGEIRANIDIRLWRTENLSVRDTITLKLVPTADLVVKMADFSTRCITFYRGFDRPDWWTDSYIDYDIGRFHEIKMEILMTILGSIGDPLADYSAWNFYKIVLNQYCIDNDIRYPDTGELVNFNGENYQ